MSAMRAKNERGERGSAHGALRFALLGAGRFGQFACEQYRELHTAQLVAVADAVPGAALAASQHLGVPAASVEEVLARRDVELVYIAAPPWTHRELAGQALAAGKHVLCEKPLAIELDSAEELLRLAQERGRVLSVNLIMRYNPLCDIVRRIIRDRLLGQPLHGFFENNAKDEPLPPEHWFWDRDKSGGIFIEHGVHFFDLYEWWLGEGEVVAAQQIYRPPINAASVIEQVQATVNYNDVLVNFHHGFTQAERMDRQEMRLIFERGSIRLFEWVPTGMEIDCLATEATRDAIGHLLPHHEMETLATYQGQERQVTSRHKDYEVDGRYLFRAHAGMSKSDLYGHVLRGLLDDQVRAIRDPNHRRRITEENGYRSLQTAVAAQRLADEQE